MSKFAKPWFRPSRGVWYITLGGKQYSLGACAEEQATERAEALKKQRKRDIALPVASDNLPVVIDIFLDWLPRRAPHFHTAANIFREPSAWLQALRSLTEADQ